MKSVVIFILLFSFFNSIKADSTYLFISGVFPSPKWKALSVEVTPESQLSSDPEYYLGVRRELGPNQEWYMSEQLFGSLKGHCLENWKMVPCTNLDHDKFEFLPMPKEVVDTNKPKYFGFGNLRNKEDGKCANVVKYGLTYMVEPGPCNYSDEAIWYRHDLSTKNKKEL